MRTSIVVTLALLVPMTTSAQETSPWADLARDDIAAAFEFIERVHVGPVDPENPAFRSNMENARDRALELADRVESFEGYRFTLMAFTDAFEDGHMNVAFRVATPTRWWPGFLVLKRGKNFVVSSVEETTAGLRDAVVKECDGIPVLDLLGTEVLPYRGVGTIDGAIARAVPYLFLHEGNPFATLPSACDFRLSRGETVNRDLEWKRISAEAWSSRLEAARGAPASEAALEEYAPSRFWISLPSFLPHGDEVGVFESLLDELDAPGQEIRTAASIVLDVRGNRGGNSTWGTRVAHALWGRDYVVSRMPFEPRRVHWRVSDVALTRLDHLIERDARNGLTENVALYERVKAGLLAARARGEELWEETHENSGEPAGRAPVENPVDADVFVLTDEGCRSACLNFLDLVRPLESVTFVGSPTYADAVYNESITHRLPSGIATLYATIKMIRRGLRGHNEPYVPDVAYEGRDWSRPALEAWIAGLVP